MAPAVSLVLYRCYETFILLIFCKTLGRPTRQAAVCSRQLVGLVLRAPVSRAGIIRQPVSFVPKRLNASPHLGGCLLWWYFERTKSFHKNKLAMRVGLCFISTNPPMVFANLVQNSSPIAQSLVLRFLS